MNAANCEPELEVVPSSTVRDIGERALHRAGYPRDEVTQVVDHLLDAALCGYPESLGVLVSLSHQPDLSRRPMEIVSESPTTITIDGGGALGYVTAARLADLLIEKARKQGIAVGVARNCSGTGRSAYYVERIARTGLIGLHAAGGGGGAIVAPPGATEGILGTNPIAFGFPMVEGPLVFDMSTSAVTTAGVRHRAHLGQRLPEGVALDSQGKPTTDPGLALGGSFLAFDGYKGFGLSLSVQLLSLLASAGSAASRDTPGSFMTVIDPAVFLPVQHYRKAAQGLIERIKSLPRRPGTEDIRLPSERSFRLRRMHTERGLPVDRRLLDQLRELADGPG